MVSVDLETAACYRQHAEELRIGAEDAETPKIRRILLNLAADYETMAESLETIDRTNKILAQRVAPSDPDEPQ